MKTYQYKEIKGPVIRAEDLRLPRAISIYKSIKIIGNCVLIECRRKTDSSEVILFTLKRIGVPEEPAFDIHNEEDIAIVCSKSDLALPEVYALRDDFPIALPHSNARDHLHPVSLCISDVPYTDIRHQFSAYDFLCYIRRWLLLNSRNKLHEADRPIEVFFAAPKFCELRLSAACDCKYALLSAKTDSTFTIDLVKKNKASHFMVGVCISPMMTSSFAAMPQTMGELASYKDSEGIALHLSILDRVLTLASAANTLPILVSLFIKQFKKENKTETRLDIFTVIIDQSPCIIRHKMQRMSETSFMEWYESLKVELLFTLHQPLLLQNRESNMISHTLDKVTFIGCGTLGGNLIDNLVREGFCNHAVLVDYDCYLPHNTSRHVLPVSYTMQHKAKSLQECLKGICDQKIDVVIGDVLSMNETQRKIAFCQTSLIVDASTSIAVERSLALDARLAGIRKCTVFLNPKGTDLVFLLEDSDGSQRLDLLEMSYLRAVLTDAILSSHLDTSGIIRTNEFSCRSESSVINYDNVKMLGAVVSQQLKTRTADDKSFIGIWHVNESDSTICKITPVTQKWTIRNVNDIQIYIANDLINEISSLIIDKGDMETGGCLIGCYDKDRRIIYLIYQICEPKGSVCTPCSFIRGCEGLNASFEEVQIKTANLVRYLGEWHSHPNGPSSPSEADKRQYAEMSKHQEYEDVPYIQMIMGNSDLYLNARM